MKQVDPLIGPRGLSRSQAAAYVGIGTILFDRLVAAGTMPQPREIGGRRVWDRQEVDRAFEELPHVGDAASARDPWDVILGEAPPPKDTMTYTGDDGGHLPNAYTPASLAKRWKCSPRHIRNMVKRGELEAIALGGKLLRITRDVVEAYEDRRDGAA
jgi:excisionase family DNA binding protein